MHNLSLTPATQAVLDALTELGQGNVHELADKSGKARSTVDRSIKTLADAGMIAAVDTDADPAEGVPTRWTLATAADDLDTQLETDADDAGDDLPGDDDTNVEDPADQPETDPSAEDGFGDEPPTDDDQASDTDEGNFVDELTSKKDDASDDSDNDADLDDDADDYGDLEDSDDDTDDEDQDQDDDRRSVETVTVIRPSRPGDRRVMTIKAVLSEHGEHGATLEEIVAESGIGHQTASRLLSAMEQADAARLLDGRPLRWVAGPTKASEVDPNPEPPRCPVCYQNIRGQITQVSASSTLRALTRPDGTLHVLSSDGTPHVVTLPKRPPVRTPGISTATVRRSNGNVNGDGSQPFGRGELEKLTHDILIANPGRVMSPQDIANVIGTEFGRTVSPGAVRNNCTKLAAGGRVLLVSEVPLTVVYPAQDTDATEDLTNQS